MYLKDYKKILEGVVNVINTTERSDIGFADICTYISENCPELKESEDERMWKLIKKYAHSNISDMALGADHITREQLESWLEKQSKQKPKFKVGDWVINDHCLGEIILLTDDTYLLDNGQSVPFSCKTTRLWDIAKDAKEGDVLVNGSNIFIFHFINGTRLMGYCHVNTDDGRFYDDIGKNECFCLIDAVVNPTTKEQRDLLFSKMHESGYEWDAEKKMLKKIEQKSAWSEDDEDAIGQAIVALEDMFDEDHPQNCYAGYKLPFIDAAERLKSLKDRYSRKCEHIK